MAIRQLQVPKTVKWINSNSLQQKVDYQVSIDRNGIVQFSRSFNHLIGDLPQIRAGYDRTKEDLYIQFLAEGGDAKIRQNGSYKLVLYRKALSCLDLMPDPKKGRVLLFTEDNGLEVDEAQKLIRLSYEQATYNQRKRGKMPEYL